MNIGQSALLTDLAMCVNYFRLFSPGTYCCVHARVQIEPDTLITPGVIAMVNYGSMKQCDPDEQYERFHGPPNFVLDVFPQNDWKDYESRRDVMQRCGVVEYVAVRDGNPIEWIWNRRINEHFTEVESDHDEMILSTALPGFWVPVEALRQRDWWAIMAATARGVSRQGHHELMDTIWNA